MAGELVVLLVLLKAEMMVEKLATIEEIWMVKKSVKLKVIKLVKLMDTPLGLKKVVNWGGY
jgi:hypothetical protein